MPITREQAGVLKGILPGAIVALCLVGLGAEQNSFGYTDSLDTIDRLSVAISASMLPALFLAIAIGRLARHRFFTPEDIDGGGLSEGTAKAKLLQSLLQNTVEQTVLAIVVYCAWAVVMPAASLSVVPLAAVAFGLGRLLFFAGYEKGAAFRAFGFTLSFYPSVFMLIALIGALF